MGDNMRRPRVQLWLEAVQLMHGLFLEPNPLSTVSQHASARNKDTTMEEMFASLSGNHIDVFGVD